MVRNIEEAFQETLLSFNYRDRASIDQDIYNFSEDWYKKYGKLQNEILSVDSLYILLMSMYFVRIDKSMNITQFKRILKGVNIDNKFRPAGLLKCPEIEDQTQENKDFPDYFLERIFNYINSL